MVPMIYAGLGGSSPANLSLDWLQQYAGQLQTAHQQVQQQPSPQLRRESRVISQAPPSSYPQTIQQQVMPTQQPVEQPPPNQPLQTTFSAYPSVQQQRTATAPAPRSAAHASLPRLTTNEMYVHQPPHNPGSAHPHQQGQGIQQEPPASSPSIYFHHWVPPNEANKNQQPPTPASKGEPSSAHPGSHLPEGGEHKESPRKRKAQGGHQPVPPPASAGPHYTSPSFSTMSSTSRKAGHARTRSSGSTRGFESRPQSRRGPEPVRSQAPPFERIEDRGRRETSIERRSGAPPSLESRAFGLPARREER
ncbi:hypothetical protein KC364_g14137 [Hortaea werneckii]|nr:hypothetical protein KC364_g14137 [Hortaea werneckii]